MVKFKIGDKVYDSELQPIMIILSDEDKKNIANMNQKCVRYCSYPSLNYWMENNRERIHKFMRLEDDE